jgi:hypothetical protein
MVFLVERNAESIAAALQKLRDMDQQTLSTNARQSILDGWTWKQQSQKYVTLFQALANEDGLGERRKHHPKDTCSICYIADAKVCCHVALLTLPQRFLLARRYTPFYRARCHRRRKKIRIT